MELQTIFNIVLQHLARQASAAMTEEVCAYRGYSGTKCAVGCLIAEKDYDSGIEGMAVSSGGGFVADYLPFPCNEKGLLLLSELQSIHDTPYRIFCDCPRASTKHELLRRATRTAFNFGLIIPRAFTDWVESYAGGE